MGKLADEAEGFVPKGKGGAIDVLLAAQADDDDRAAIVRLLQRDDIGHVELAEWLTARGFPISDHPIRSWRKRNLHVGAS